MKNTTTETDICSLVGLTFTQLLHRMVEQADAIQQGAVRVGSGESFTSDEERFTGALRFAKALATRLETEHTHGEITAIRKAVADALTKKANAEFINLPEDDSETDPATLQALKELGETPKISFAAHAKALQDEVRAAQIKAALEFIERRKPFEGQLITDIPQSDIDAELAESRSEKLPEGLNFVTPLYDSLVASLQGLFGALGLISETNVVLQAEQAAHIAGLRDDLRTLTLTLTEIAQTFRNQKK